MPCWCNVPALLVRIEILLKAQSILLQKSASGGQRQGKSMKALGQATSTSVLEGNVSTVCLLIKSITDQTSRSVAPTTSLKFAGYPQVGQDAVL